MAGIPKSSSAVVAAAVLPAAEAARMPVDRSLAGAVRRPVGRTLAEADRSLAARTLAEVGRSRAVRRAAVVVVRTQEGAERIAVAGTLGTERVGALSARRSLHQRCRQQHLQRLRLQQRWQVEPLEQQYPRRGRFASVLPFGRESVSTEGKRSERLSPRKGHSR